MRRGVLFGGRSPGHGRLAQRPAVSPRLGCLLASLAALGAKRMGLGPDCGKVHLNELVRREGDIIFIPRLVAPPADAAEYFAGPALEFL